MTIKKDHFYSRAGGKYMSHKDQKACRDIIKLHGMLSCFNSKASPLENLLFNTATAIYEFFHANGYSVSRVRWDNKEVSPDLMSYCGWLYAFYGEQEYPCYVGETGRTINLRFGEHKRSAPWWPDWKNVKILPCPNKSVRKVFESLVGLAGGYYENKMQPAEADNILEDIILSLLLRLFLIL